MLRYTRVLLSFSLALCVWIDHKLRNEWVFVCLLFAVEHRCVSQENIAENEPSSLRCKENELHHHAIQQITTSKVIHSCSLGLKSLKALTTYFALPFSDLFFTISFSFRSLSPLLDPFALQPLLFALMKIIINNDVHKFLWSIIFARLRQAMQHILGVALMWCALSLSVWWFFSLLSTRHHLCTKQRSEKAQKKRKNPGPLNGVVNF